MTPAFAILGGIVSAVGAFSQANATARADQYNAAVDKRNALAISEQTSQDVLDQASQNRRRLATVRAAYGAAGIDLAGSPLDVIQDTAITQNVDLQRTKYAGDVKATGERDQSTLDLMAASSAKTAGNISAVGAIFGGFTQAGMSLERAA